MWKPCKIIPPGEKGKATGGGRGIEEEEEERGIELSLLGQIQATLKASFVYLKSPGMLTILLVTPIEILMLCFLYLGILLNANNFTSNDPFVYVALTGVMDFVAIVLATPLNMRLGRRILLAVCFLVGGSCLLLELAIPTELRWVKWVLVMTAMLLASAAFQVNLLYVSELFPTVIRSRGFGLVYSVGNLGFSLVPVITDVLALQAGWVPSAAFGAAGILAGLLLPLLPETNNKPLPDTLQDVEERRRRSKKSSSSSSRKNDNNRQQEAINKDAVEDTTSAPLILDKGNLNNVKKVVHETMEVMIQ